MTGWSKFSAGAIGGNAENYANTHGAIGGGDAESGSHFENRSTMRLQAAISFLALLKMIDGPEE